MPTVAGASPTIIPLSQMEQQTIRQHKIDLQKAIQKLDVDIDKLLRQKLNLFNRIKECDISLAPHKRLPLEILRAIFLLCGSEPTVIQVPLEEKEVLAISRVCSAWRQLALDTPTLWNNIKFTSFSARSMAVAKEWLSRAKNLPVSFTVNVPDTYYDKSVGKACHTVIEKLIGNYPCRGLNITLRYWENKLTVPLGNESLATLESLSLNLTDYRNLFSEVELPKLKSLTLSKNLVLKNIRSAIPWAQLQYLHLEQAVPATQCLDLLRQCLQLEECEANIGSGSSSAQDLIIEDIVLPAMRKLKLVFHDKTNASTFVQSLVTPNLTSLSLVKTPEAHSDLDVDLSTILQLVARSNSTPLLQTLIIGKTTDSINLGDILSNIPTLRELSIVHGPIDADSMNKISMGVLGPHLEVLSSGQKHDAEDIIQMVESRQQLAADSKIKSFSSVRINCVAANASSLPALGDRLRRLRHSGVDVILQMKV